MTKLPKCEVSQSSKRILFNEHQHSRSGLDSYSIGSMNHLAGKTDKKKISVADPDPGSNAFLTPGSGIRDG
jgi:hypothetical protein